MQQERDEASRAHARWVFDHSPERERERRRVMRRASVRLRTRELTRCQESVLDGLPEGCIVVGRDEWSVLVRRADAEIVRVGPDGDVT